MSKNVHLFASHQFVLSAVSRSAFAALLAIILVLLTFLSLEPTVGRAQDTDSFTVTQSITAEISFTTEATDVVMSPSLAGITGGTSNGEAQVVVNTNNSAGYNMTIAFSSSTAMYKNGGGDEIPNYSPAVAGTPDYNFGSEVFGQFGYTVVASTSSELDPSFRDNGSACATGSGNTAGTCWLDPDTNAETIINTTSATPSSTTTVAFRVVIPSNPVPAISTGTYTATATLTATTN